MQLYFRKKKNVWQNYFPVAVKFFRYIYSGFTVNKNLQSLTFDPNKHESNRRIL